MRLHVGLKQLILPIKQLHTSTSNMISDKYNPIYGSVSSNKEIACVLLLISCVVLLNLFASISKLAVIVDVSMKMKSDLYSAFNEVINPANRVNGTLSIRSFTSKRDMLTDFRKWEKKTNFNTSNLVPDKTHLRSASSQTTITNIEIINSTDAFSKVTKTHDNLHIMSKNKTSKFDNTPIEPSTQNVIHSNQTNIVNKVDNKNNNISAVQKLQRKDNCVNCFPHDFNWVIENNQICALESEKDTIDILIVIMTIHENTQNRNAIRKTWLTTTNNNTAAVRYVFLLGEIKDKNKQNAVLEESKLYEDIIKEAFIDAYANLTYKTIMGFKWASSKCAHVRFIMKTDDDMFVNVPNLLKLVQTNGDILQTSIGGACAIKAAPVRNAGSKYYASFDSYPGKSYPGYCSGTGYITSMSVAKKVYEVSSSIPFFYLEDVYVALCIKKLGLHLHRFQGFNTGRPKLDPCVYKGTTLITAHRLNPLDLQLIWAKKCKPKSISRI